jgi:hypothetical protein
MLILQMRERPAGTVLMQCIKERYTRALRPGNMIGSKNRRSHDTKVLPREVNHVPVLPITTEFRVAAKSRDVPIQTSR